MTLLSRLRAPTLVLAPFVVRGVGGWTAAVVTTAQIAIFTWAAQGLP